MTKGRKKAILTIGIAGGLVAVFLVFMTLGDGIPEDGYGPVDPGPGSDSRSALGFLLFHDTLKEAGWKVLRRRTADGFPTGKDEALIVTRSSRFLSEENNPDDLGKPGRALVILPKFQAVEDTSHKGWVKDVSSDNGITAYRVLLFLLGDEKKDLGSTPTIVEGPLSEPFTQDILGIRPDLGDKPAQLIRSNRMTPLVATSDGILLGELTLPGGKKAWVLSDPDILNNQGLLKGQNLEFAMALVENWALGGPKPTIVFYDPDVPGGSGTQDRQKEVPLRLRLPNILVALLALVAALLLAFFGLHRYWPEENPSDRVAFGKLGLIRNSARLITGTGREREIFLKWAAFTLDSLGRLLHAPKPVLSDRDGLLSFLDRSLPRMIPGAKLPSALWAEALRLAKGAAGAAPRSQMLRCASQLHSWKETLESGPGTLGKDNQ